MKDSGSRPHNVVQIGLPFPSIRYCTITIFPARRIFAAQSLSLRSSLSTSPHYLYLCLILVLSAGAYSSFAADKSEPVKIPDDQKLSLLLAGASHNRDLIRSGVGSVQLTYERTIKPLPESERDVSSLKLNNGIESRHVSWMFNETNNRSDVDSLDIGEGKQRFGSVEHTKTSWSATDRIYVVPTGGNVFRAYINAPRPKSFRYVRDCLAFFDPLLFFNIDDNSLEGWTAFCRKRAMNLSITAERGRWKIIAEATTSTPPYRVEISVDENEGFNVTSFLLFGHHDDVPNLPAIQCDMSYSDWGSSGEAFFPKTYHLLEYFDQARHWREEVTASFSGVKLNCPVDTNLFTFEGMGLAKGSRLTDMRVDPPIEMYWGGLPAASLDELVAQINGSTPAKGGSGPTSQSPSNAPAAPQAVAATRLKPSEAICYTTLGLGGLLAAIYTIRRFRRSPRS